MCIQVRSNVAARTLYYVWYQVASILIIPIKLLHQLPEVLFALAPRLTPPLRPLVVESHHLVPLGLGISARATKR
jgi:hypothetical protein